MKSTKDLMEDALNATRAAIQEGIVPGGGVALLHATEAIKALKLKGDERFGASIVLKAMEAPLRQIAENAGEDGAVVVETVREHGGNIGWNALMFSDYGPVHTFDPYFHPVIRKNVTQNNLANPVAVHEYGLGAEDADLDIFITKKEPNGLRNYGAASLHPIPDEHQDPNHAGYEKEGVTVHIKKLDDVYSGVPSVIKLDVERHEMDVILGAWKTITTHRPSMYIEILDPGNDEIVKLLEPLGYKMLERPEHNYLFICSDNRS
jgi:FkbM family methyltransferase